MVIAQANDGLVSIDVEGKGYEHVGIIGVVLEGCAVGTDARAAVPACIPGRHEVEMGDSMVSQGFGEDELR